MNSTDDNTTPGSGCCGEKPPAEDAGTCCASSSGAPTAQEAEAGACHETKSQEQRHGAPAAACCAPAPASGASCHTEESGDGCCGPTQRRDYLLWGSAAVVGIGYLLGAFMPHAHDNALGVFAGGIFELFNRMWWGLLIGIFFVGLLGRVPRELVIGLLGRKAGTGGLLRATLAGVFLDLCSHGILAVGMKLYERGASAGQVMAFLLASPWNSFSLTLILFGLIGMGWTFTFIVLSAVIGVVTGLVFDALVARGTLPPNPAREQLGAERPLGEVWSEVRGAARFSPSGAWDIFREGIAGSRPVIRWSLFGLALAGAIRALVPMDDFATWFGASFAGLWLTLLATTIIEVCSEGSTPIAADLMNRAQAPGNAFTFLMAGVATDYTEVMTLRETTHSWKIALFLPLVTVPQVMLVGFILNQFSPG
ncbi:ATPase [Mangrovimicrobium sediminis]|uniref:ATPase n=1 Tax=Mangrovimicrobium sediminis TaxID=2562682 RepID=A0A4Z0M9L1_9GAMM|nr:permease [Haliea sp. SAOS-164]TGD76076.1 ATPase [Haliea sp. SAOS-164]